MKGNVSDKRQFVRQLTIDAIIYLLCHPLPYLLGCFKIPWLYYTYRDTHSS